MKNKIDKYIKKIRKDGYAIIPNLVSKNQMVGFRTVSSNNGKEYEVYLTKTGKKRWRKFKAPV